MDTILVMVKADGSRRSFPLSDGPTTVGRKNSCGLRIPLTSVSRLHCEFRVAGGQVSVRDLGSSNGTFKNGERVQDTDLGAGDEVGVGPVRFTVVIDGEPEAALTGEAVAASSNPGDTAGLDEILGDAEQAAAEDGLPTTGVLSGGASVDLATEEAVAADDLGEDEELAAAMASMDVDDSDDVSLGNDLDDSSEFAFTLDDDDDDGDDAPVIELLDEDDDKP